MARPQSFEASSSTPQEFVPGVPYHKILDHGAGRLLSKSFGSEPEAAELEKINAFARAPSKATDLYVLEAFICNDVVDRDRERFPLEMLHKFCSTIVGKGVFVGHNKAGLPSGIWYDARVEATSFDNVSANWLVGRCALDREDDKSLIKKLDRGWARFVSVGFIADDLKAVTKEGSEEIDFWEFVDKGSSEATECSIVWLGAQYGAGVRVKNLRTATDREVGETMKLKIKGQTFEIEKAPDGFREAVELVDRQHDEAHGLLKILGEPKTAEEAKRLVADAAEGRAYQKDLVEQCLAKGKLAGILDDKNAKEDRELFESYPSARLKTQLAHFLKTLKAKGRDLTEEAGPGDEDDEEGGEEEERKSARRRPMPMYEYTMGN